MPNTQPALRRILYAEDDPDIQHIARYALERLGGYEVKLCSSATEALGQVETFAPDLILLDAMLPEMNGVELLKRMRSLASQAHTPVVFVTAKVQEQELRQFRSAGALDVITKPFNPMTLAKELATLWARHLAATCGSAAP